ncbi:MAG: hypothetical protein IPG63_14005 [Xanthomonadales bacterium]|nr:hypothetical protein [Xanthomonadales bacterium]MBK7145801.1 hypothetical protein [Xanthomonadales bacterium]
MQTLTEGIIEAGWSERVISEGQLRRLVSGSDQRRYHLVNRAAAAGELVRLRRGRYVLGHALQRRAAHPFVLAQGFEAGSYVSFETALAYHGWIPEAVRSVASVTSGSKSATYQPAGFGSYSFHPLAIEPSGFLLLVERVELSGQCALVARPLRALMDLVCLRKQAWQGIAWLIEGLRIDADALRSVTGDELRALRQVYRQRRVQAFLKALSRALGDD